MARDKRVYTARDVDRFTMTAQGMRNIQTVPLTPHEIARNKAEEKARAEKAKRRGSRKGR